MNYSIFRSFFFCFLLTFSLVRAQPAAPATREMNCVMFSAYGGWSFATGDMLKDYGGSGEVGVGILYQTKKKWLMGLDYSYFFGSDVKKDPIPNLRTPDGYVIGFNGSYASFEVTHRGFQFPLVRFGKTFHAWKPSKFNQVGGLTLMAGGAWFQHWTLIQDKSKKTPQFSEEYLDGYDKMRSGPGFGGWLGYLYLPEFGKINFHLEAGYFMAFTTSRRYDFAYQIPAGQSFRDGLIQMRLRICFTVRSRPEETYYYY